MKKEKNIVKHKHSACREKQKNLSMQTPLSCYVCGKQIKEDAGMHIGKNTYRHKHCAPGTMKWFKSNIGKQSELREYFKGNEEET